MNVLAWVLTPKWHVFWWCFKDFKSIHFSDFYMGAWFWDPSTWIYLVWLGWLKIDPGIWYILIHTTAEAYAHVLLDCRRLRLNPRFTHTFADEDTMSQLKKWARRSNGKKRERVVSRLSRMRLRTLVWKLPELANRARWTKRCFPIETYSHHTSYNSHVKVDLVKHRTYWDNLEFL